jgi:hypothetical protein
MKNAEWVGGLLVGAESLEGWRLPVTEWDSVKDTRKKFEPFEERVIIAGITNPFKIAWHINTGIEILNPIESNCMSPSEIKKRHSDKLAFHGAISVQKTIPNGTVQDVKIFFKDPGGKRRRLEDCDVVVELHARLCRSGGRVAISRPRTHWREGCS